jgi:DNA invertase Pin-like site-specific DNA recombinase
MTRRKANGGQRRLSRRITLLSLAERIDTNSAAGELVFHVFGAIAHFKRDRGTHKRRHRRRAHG